jgi:hypothetical protein
MITRFDHVLALYQSAAPVVDTKTDTLNAVLTSVEMVLTVAMATRPTTMGSKKSKICGWWNRK